MPYPARKTVSPLENGSCGSRQASPKRGAKFRVSGLTAWVTRSSWGGGGLGPAAYTRVSRFPRGVVYGGADSERRPRFNVRRGLTRQSSCTKPPKLFCRRYACVLPSSRLVFWGKPNRKSASASPVEPGVPLALVNAPV